MLGPLRRVYVACIVFARACASRGIESASYQLYRALYGTSVTLFETSDNVNVYGRLASLFSWIASGMVGSRSFPLFIYLMSSGRHPYIGMASNPMYRIRCHNREAGLPPGTKSTRAGAPNWKLVMVIGPFYRGASRFHAQWRDESRKLNCRIAHGCLKGLSYRTQGIRIWATDPQFVLRTCRHSVRHHTRRVAAAFDVLRRVNVLTAPT